VHQAVTTQVMPNFKSTQQQEISTELNIVLTLIIITYLA